MQWSGWLIKHKRLSRNNMFIRTTIAGVLSVLALSVAYRLYKGKPIFRPDFPEAQFVETWRSGASERYILKLLGGARHCLWVVVTPHELWVSPHFPFNLWFIPEVLHLDFRIPGKTILAITATASSQEHVVSIRFRHATGDEDSLAIRVKNLEAFRKALSVIRQE